MEMLQRRRYAIKVNYLCLVLGPCCYTFDQQAIVSTCKCWWVLVFSIVYTSELRSRESELTLYYSRLVFFNSDTVLQGLNDATSALESLSVYSFPQAFAPAAFFRGEMDGSAIVILSTSYVYIDQQQFRQQLFRQSMPRRQAYIFYTIFSFFTTCCLRFIPHHKFWSDHLASRSTTPRSVLSAIYSTYDPYLHSHSDAHYVYLISAYAPLRFNDLPL